MAHLGDRVTALVDGQLPADAVERAHAHLAHCRPCRDAVEAERLMKARLASLRGPEPGADLMQRLLGMGGPNGPLPPRVGHVPGMPRTPAVALPRTIAPPVLARTPLPVEAPEPVAAGELVQVPELVEVAALVGSADPVDPTEDGGSRFGGATGPADPAALVPGRVVVGSGRGNSPAGPATAMVGRPSGRRPARQLARAGSSGPGRAPSRRRTRLAMAAVFGALSVVGVGITGFATSAVGSSPRVPTVVPPVDSFVVDHVRTTRDLPFVDVPAGWQLTSAVQGGGAGR